MIAQEQTPLKGGLLADACGLGKTLTALTLIWAANSLTPLGPQEIPRRFALSLILVPNALVDTWMTEIDRHFGDALTVFLFFGSSTRTSHSRRKEQTISKASELKKALRALDPHAPSTGLTIVLSSYQTWARRTTDEIGEDSKPIRRARRGTRTSRPMADPKALNPAMEEE
ncbi:Helicase C-terminal [Penicillium sp. IBT 18751x]|nr:Helicase C-terminal [Penicillium sp. IBT 18751x]